MSRKTDSRLIGVTIGEPAGIGPELLFQSFRSGLLRRKPFLVIADDYSLKRSMQLAGIHVRLNPIVDSLSSDLNPDSLNYYPVDAGVRPAPFQPGIPNRYSSSLAYEAIAAGVRLCLQKQLSGLVTNPVSKEHIIRAGHHSFTGHTGLLSDLSGIPEKADMVFGCTKGIVGLVTTHIPLKNVSREITKHAVSRLISRMTILTRRFFHTEPVFAVLGLNPHAGEAGTMGSEENRIIIPAIHSFRKKGLSIKGPFPADSFWRNHFSEGRFNAVLAMYHDQGLIPVKSGLLGDSTNISLGLPFIRTSPDHGTAFDIAGKGQADPSGFEFAFQTALKLIQG